MPWTHTSRIYRTGVTAEPIRGYPITCEGSQFQRLMSSLGGNKQRYIQGLALHAAADFEGAGFVEGIAMTRWLLDHGTICIIENGDG